MLEMRLVVHDTSFSSIVFSAGLTAKPCSCLDCPSNTRMKSLTRSFNGWRMISQKSSRVVGGWEMKARWIARWYAALVFGAQHA